jgi:atypical dual specificity phosphatase
LNFDWIAEGRLAAMAMPWPSDLPLLRKAGIRSVLSLCERGVGEIEDAGFRHLVLPVRDFHAPTARQLEEAVQFIDASLKAGGACVVHCGAGLGRTGTVAAAWLVRHGRSADAAIAEVRRRRPGSIETTEQEAAILAFAKAEERRRA